MLSLAWNYIDEYPIIDFTFWFDDTEIETKTLVSTVPYHDKSDSTHYFGKSHSNAVGYGNFGGFICSIYISNAPLDLSDISGAFSFSD